MVDWSLSSNTVKSEPPLRRNQTKKTTIRPGPQGVRKSKPLVSNINQHLLHSGKKRPKHQTVTVRRVKRDSAGNTIRLRKM